MKKISFTTQIAKEIAYKSFDYTLDCISGVTDNDYSLGNEGEEFEQNFAEDLEERGMTVTAPRLGLIATAYNKLRRKAILKLQTHYSPSVRAHVMKRN